MQCAEFPAAEAGERFTARFTLRTLKNDRYRLARQSDGVYLRAEYVGSYSPLPASRHPVFWLYRLRQRGSTALKRWMPADSAALISAMLLGDTSRLSDTDRDAFAAAGVSHLLAVSGLHVSLLAGLLFPRKRRFAHTALAVQAGVIVGYMLLTGLPVSVLRAGLVFLLAILGHWFLQPVDLLTSTGAAALLLGLQNAYMPCDLGFQLSFCAVLGVQCAASLAGQPKNRLSTRIFSLTSNALTAALAALFTLPVLVAHGMTVSAVVVLGNLLTLPLMEPLLLLGLAVLGLSCLPFLAPVCHTVSFLLALLLKLLRCIVLFCASLPGARLLLPARYTLFVLGVLAVLALVYYFAGSLRLQPRPGQRGARRPVLRGACRLYGRADAAGHRHRCAGRHGGQPLRRHHPRRAGGRGVPGRRSQPPRGQKLSGAPRRPRLHAGSRFTRNAGRYRSCR